MLRLTLDGVNTPIEGLAMLECHVNVNRSSEAIELADRPPAPARDVAQRDAAFVRLADEHLDKSYRLARAILRDPAEAQEPGLNQHADEQQQGERQQWPEQLMSGAPLREGRGSTF